MSSLVEALVAALRRRVLGISPEEIRYTFEDVRKELRDTRAELKEELAQLRREVRDVQELAEAEDKVAGPEVPVPEA
jgi:hypothetical protein